MAVVREAFSQGLGCTERAGAGQEMSLCQPEDAGLLLPFDLHALSLSRLLWTLRCFHISLVTYLDYLTPLGSEGFRSPVTSHGAINMEFCVPDHI